jgi:hypothetical protein
MGRVYTSRIETKMIDRITREKRPFVKLKREAMRPYLLLLAIYSRIKKAVSIGVHCSTPEPTSRGLLDLGLETHNGIGEVVSICHAPTIPLSIPAVNYTRWLGLQLFPRIAA